jgi:MFS family permease
VKPAASKSNAVERSRIKVPLFRPFRHPRFRNLCIANFFSNVGTWFQTFGAAWLVATQSGKPGTAALAQTITSLPIFLFAIFGGVLADRMDRGKFLLAVHVQMAGSALWLGILTWVSSPSVNTILALTFLIGVGAAFRVSAWQASMSGLVPADELEAAATLNGLSFNLASIIGPVAGGWLFVRAGASSLFLLNAASYTGLIILYVIWVLDPPAEELSPKHLDPSYATALASGIIACFSNSGFRKILLSTFAIFSSVSVLQSLLPVLVNTGLQETAANLGLVLGAYGAGAVAAAFILPSLRALAEPWTLLGIAGGTFAAVLAAIAIAPIFWVLLVVSTIGGFAWAALVSTMNSSAQATFATAMRARALAVYSVVMAGSLALGSVVWGQIANHLGISASFGFAAAALFAASILVCYPRPPLAVT